MALVFRPAEDDDLNLLRRWRNQQEVRDLSFNRHEISAKEHLDWWHRVSDDPTRQVHIMHENGHLLGVVTIYDFDEDARSCWWGFHLGDEKSLGQRSRMDLWLGIEEATINLVFLQLGCGELLCESLARNQWVLDLHDRFGFVEDRRETRAFEDRNEEVVIMALRRTPAQRMLILGSANWDAAAEQLEQEWPTHANEPLKTSMPGFNQYRLLLNDPKSLLYQPYDIILAAERFEDFLPRPFAAFQLTEKQQIKQRFGQWLETLQKIRDRLSGQLYILELAPVTPIEATLSEHAGDKESASGLVALLNEDLAKFAAGLPDTNIIRTGRLIQEVGRVNADPGKYFQLGRFAYGAPLISVLGRQLAGYELARRGLSARVLVLDLDNTLWGGVIGDDGLEGIELGNDFPGNSYVAIQEAAKALTERGIVLALCSKNTEEVALSAFQKHPAMVLKEKDLAGWRINWSPKEQNISELANEMSLGLGSFCFLDDNPHEREAVRQALPQVHVLDWPEDVSEIPQLLLRHPRLQSVSLTGSDRKRTKSYQTRRALNQAQDLATSREEFLAGLDLKLIVKKVDPMSRRRVLQLLAKTNQFNMTTRRHGETELQTLEAKGAKIYALSSQDRFAEREIIGAMVLKQQDSYLVIESLLLSCRVLGKDLEHGIVAFATQRAREEGLSHLLGEFIPTDRNAPAAKLYPDLGFTKTDDGFIMDLSKDDCVLPSHIKLERSE